MISFGQMIF
ncbi:UNVERIFIED_CONTAM: hypothetical protein GTU68_016638 [Idotea baltica]|nr:hypothetical protein [Idotea baltica]